MTRLAKRTGRRFVGQTGSSVCAARARTPRTSRAEGCASARRAATRSLVTAGTIFHATQTPLQKWFLAIFFLSLGTSAESPRCSSNALSASAAIRPPGRCSTSFAPLLVSPQCANDLPALTGPGTELVYAASWFMGNSSPGTMISGAGGLYPSALCGRIVRSGRATAR